MWVRLLKLKLKLKRVAENLPSKIVNSIENVKSVESVLKSWIDNDCIYSLRTDQNPLYIKGI